MSNYYLNQEMVDYKKLFKEEKEKNNKLKKIVQELLNHIEEGIDYNVMSEHDEKSLQYLKHKIKKINKRNKEK